jgi:hypothetical protein
MKRLLLALVIVALASPVFAAETYVKTNTHSDPMTAMGRAVPARDSSSEMWLSGSRMAMVSRESSFIVDLDAQKAYLVNHRTKSYVESGLPFELGKLLPPEMAQMATMMQVTATVTPTTETKRFGQWECTGYDAVVTAMGMPMNLRIWASTQVPFDVARFQSTFMPALLQSQMQLTKSALAEFAKIKGYQIATETTANMMGVQIHSTTEVVEISQKPAPAGIFAPPDGYTKKTTLGLDELQRR